MFTVTFTPVNAALPDYHVGYLSVLKILVHFVKIFCRSSLQRSGLTGLGVTFVLVEVKCTGVLSLYSDTYRVR